MFYEPYKISGTIVNNALTHGVGGGNEKAFLKYVKKPDNFINLGLAKNEVALHLTQKPLKLFTELVETHSRADDLVVDTFSGSGTIAVAVGRADVAGNIRSRPVRTLDARPPSGTIRQDNEPALDRLEQLFQR